MDLRDQIYPDAKVAARITQDPEPVCVAAGLPEWGRRRAEDSARVFANSDLVIAQGGKATDDVVRLMRAETPNQDIPPIHEFIPGFQVPHTAPRSWEPNRGEPLEILMLGRMHDQNKGAREALHALAEIVANGYDVRLNLQGVTPIFSEEEEHTDILKNEIRELGLTNRVRVNDFTSNSAEIDRAIGASHAMLMATDTESYGRAAHEYLITGRPVLVARGTGNGFADLLADPNRMGADVGERFVVDDRGTRGLTGSVMGSEDESTQQPRHTLLAERLTELHDNYAAHLETAGRAQERLRAYSPTDTVEFHERALASAIAGEGRHSKQGPNGRELPMSHPALIESPAPQPATERHKTPRPSENEERRTKSGNPVPPSASTPATPRRKEPRQLPTSALPRNAPGHHVWELFRKDSAEGTSLPHEQRTNPPHSRGPDPNPRRQGPKSGR